MSDTVAVCPRSVKLVIACIIAWVLSAGAKMCPGRRRPGNLSDNAYYVN